MSDQVLCPRCGDELQTPDVRNALSRVDNATYICDDCGIGEALFDAHGVKLPPVNEWLMPKGSGIESDRWCAFATFDEQSWLVALVEEREPGYFATSIRSEDQAYVERRADWLNERHGIDKHAALLIVGSSMAASE